MRTRKSSFLLVMVAALSGCGGGDHTVQPPFVPDSAASVILLPESATLYVGASRTFFATAKTQSGTVISRPTQWSTTTPSVASVSLESRVTALGPGLATIIATVDAKSDSSVVTVRAIDVVAFASVTTGGAHTCALTAAGKAYCWGRGESGQLGIEPPETLCSFDGGPLSCTAVPAAVNGGLSFTQLTGGGSHTCGLTADSSAYCWGSNSTGQLGDNTRSFRYAPVPVATPLKFASLDAGADYTCGLTSAGGAYCWGKNGRGELGDGTTDTRTTPAAVSGSLTFRSISAGGFSTPGGVGEGQTCGVTTSGVAYCWGNNERGQLGLGSADIGAHPTPVALTGVPSWASITAGLGNNSCALTSAGAAYCWGQNTYGTLGIGTLGDRQVATQVLGGLVFVKVVAGGFLGHNCGLVSSGVAYCWGENSTGQVGDLSVRDRLEPTAVAGGLTFTSLDAGFRHTCGRTTAGIIYCWGSGAAGQLGTNSTRESTGPARVVGQP